MTDAAKLVKLADLIDTANLIELIGVKRGVNAEERDMIVAALRLAAQQDGAREAAIEECALLSGDLRGAR